MKEQTRQFLDLFFDPGEAVCVSPDKFGYHSVGQESLESEIELTSPHKDVPVKYVTEEDITLMAINPINGYRRDENVTTLRSFMVELDEGTLSSQLKYVQDSGLPHSVCIFSGNKSMHFGIVLDKPCNHISTWKTINSWILNILSKADQQTVNPSRSIRFPGNKRKDGKQLMQVLRYNKGRVDINDLREWLWKHQDEKPKPKPKKIYTGDIYDIDTKMPPWINDLLEKGIDQDRNVTWFKIGCHFARYGQMVNEESLIEMLGKFFNEESDFKREEWERSLQSAFKSVRGGDDV